MIATVLTVLAFTIPSTGQSIYTVPSDGEDSVHVECDGGPPQGCDSTKLYTWRSGDFRFVRAHYVRGREGQEDTFVVSAGQHTVRAKNSKGESCNGSVVSVLPGDVTSVPEQEMNGIVTVRTFDVRGRLAKRLASGIYFRESTYRDGRVRQDVVLRVPGREVVLRWRWTNRRS